MFLRNERRENRKEGFENKSKRKMSQRDAAMNMGTTD
jgi:hypothetical protein